MSNGGPAFPVVVNDPSSLKGATVAEGMTLRDWFAGQAIAALINSAASGGQMILHDVSSDASIAQAAYQLASAMLAERDE